MEWPLDGTYMHLGVLTPPMDKEFRYYMPIFRKIVTQLVIVQ